MTQAEAGKLPMHLQLQEEKLLVALASLKEAYGVAISAEEQLKTTLQSAKDVLDQNNY